MARNRTIGRQVAQSRPLASPPADVHAEYKAMLGGEFGPASFKPMDLETGQPARLSELLRRPMGLFLIALTAFVVVLGAKLYRDGVFADLWGPKSAVIEPGDRSWMLGDKLRLPEGPAVASEDVAEEAAQPAADEGKSVDKKSADDN